MRFMATSIASPPAKWWWDYQPASNAKNKQQQCTFYLWISQKKGKIWKSWDGNTLVLISYIKIILMEESINAWKNIFFFFLECLKKKIFKK